MKHRVKVGLASAALALAVSLPAPVTAQGRCMRAYGSTGCVTGGPMFSRRIAVTPGEIVRRERFVYADLVLA